MAADYWLPALRGDVWTVGALMHVATMRWVLAERAANGLSSPPEVVEALAEGDRRHPLDPRRHINLDTWSLDVGSDPEATALAVLRGAAGDPVATCAAIAAALRLGVPSEVVRATVQEVRHG
jgi:hypothetical protein